MKKFYLYILYFLLYFLVSNFALFSFENIYTGKAEVNIALDAKGLFFIIKCDSKVKISEIYFEEIYDNTSQKTWAYSYHLDELKNFDEKKASYKDKILFPFKIYEPKLKTDLYYNFVIETNFGRIKGQFIILNTKEPYKKQEIDLQKDFKKIVILSTNLF